ncbi:isochorismatase [Arthrobacter sp. MYb229]|uniref:isochorismatase family protein n=1 Tax=unclassified Arthrobacter TaxID=235627 RepID=UPI000CFE00C1|nr:MULTISPECIES: isochorismatase family protein [unclassified Arthrobacter]PRA04488.1 isochorismatase [Arthrobacter sp. MYb229]PRB51599.1 isochorismatase [Arthrobacter sp. MYb216]
MNTPRRALIVIDVQQEYFEGLLQIQYPPREQSLARTAQAIDAAQSAGIPVYIVQHQLPSEAPVFADGSATFKLNPEIERRADKAAKVFTKAYASVFAGTELESWLRENEIDTIAVTGYMTNNCVIGSVAAAEPLGFKVEVLSDATGAINIGNEAGSASAQQVHGTLMALLHSNWAAVATTEAWIGALDAGAALEASNLVVSAMEGQKQHRQ